MVSIPQRKSVRLRTLAQVPFPVSVFQRPDLPLGLENCHATSVAALRHGLSSDRWFVLYLEDDLDFAPNFVGVLHECMEADLPVVTLYCPGYQFYPAALKRALKGGESYKPGIYRLVNRRRFFGSQALLFRRDFVKRILQGWDGGLLDNRIAEIAPREMGLYAPNPVQHYGAHLRSTWSARGKPHYSRSFIGEGRNS